ncbi:MAG: RNA 2',3'-cyclic phosphodiesterase [Candidatus Odinarchaeota archaeon]
MNAFVRAFLSIDIEDHVLLSRVFQIQQKLDIQAAKMKMVEPDNIHFTMRFFGDISITSINQIRDCLKEIKITPFEIKIVGVGAFPNRRKPRVIWIGATDNSQLVIDLKLRVDELLTRIGYKTEKEKFTPHATIARVRSIKDSNRLLGNLEELANEPVGDMTVSSVSMKKSTLTPSGPIYETLWII